MPTSASIGQLEFGARPGGSIHDEHDTWDGSPGDDGLRWRERLSLRVKALANLHRPGALPDVFLFATPRGGSTWVMEILAASRAIKFFDEPLNPRRANVRYGGLIPDFAALMPDAGNDDRIVGFLRGLQAGRHGYMNPTPLRRNHRWLTNRAVFKIHEIEHLIGRVERDCRAQIVYLLRHPVATSVSRHVLPRLELFLDSPWYASLLGDAAILREVRALARQGDELQRAVVSWCFENVVPLRCAGERWLFISYEELVLNPLRSCELLAARLRLPDRNRMLAAFERPAANIAMSDSVTRAAIREPDQAARRRRLVHKWMDGVPAEKLVVAQQILSLFGIGAYRAAQVLPEARYRHFDDTARLLEGRS